MVEEEFVNGLADDDEFDKILKSMSDEEMFEYSARFRELIVRLVESGKFAPETLEEFDRQVEKYKISCEKEKAALARAEQSKKDLEAATEEFAQALFDEMERRGGKPFMLPMEKVPPKKGSN